MKKALLFGGVLLGLASQAGAQLATENFNNGLPSTWSMIKVDNNTPNTGFAAPIPTIMASQAWMTRLTNTGDSSMLTISWFTVPAKADRWLISPAFNVTDPKMILQWIDVESISGGTDSIQIWVSPTAGTTTAAFTQKVYDGPAAPYATSASTGALIFGTHGAALGQFNGQNIRIAIRDNSTNGGAVRVDNVGTTILPVAVDGKVEVVTFPKYVANTSTNPVVVKISNQGATTITSAQLNYKVDAGSATAPINLTGLSIPPLGSVTVSLTGTPIVNPTAGQHTITANLVQINGAADPVASNNTGTTPFITASKATSRAGLIEEFSSSTCVPCANFNSTFDPLANSNTPNDGASGFNVVKYQMNWPSPGTDLSYNTPGIARQNYYGVNAIPDHFTNGNPGGNGDQAEITSSKSTAAFMDISNMTYIIKKDSMIATATITPWFTATGNWRVHMAGAENHYAKVTSGAAAATFTTTQNDFYHVMRDMVNAGNGVAVTNWTSGTPQTFRWASKWTVGSVAQLNTNWWNHPMGDGELVVYVQDNDNGIMMQSNATKASWPLAVQPLNEKIGQVSVYPNPATDHTSLAFQLQSAATVNMQVVDAIGRVVYTVADQKMDAGSQMFEINTANFASGLYTIKVKADGSEINQRFSVAK